MWTFIEVIVFYSMFIHHTNLTSINNMLYITIFFITIFHQKEKRYILVKNLLIFFEFRFTLCFPTSDGVKSAMALAYEWKLVRLIVTFACRERARNGFCDGYYIVCTYICFKSERMSRQRGVFRSGATKSSICNCLAETSISLFRFFLFFIFFLVYFNDVGTD